jgi:flagellar hook-basal body complex protein FliE
MSISLITGTPLAAVVPAGATPRPGTPGASFAESLQGLLSSVDKSAGAANTAVADMVTGTGDVHHAMIALQQAEMTLNLTVQIRNKLMSAYQDVMRMSI